MDDDLTWLFDAVCGWFADAPTEAMDDPGLVSAGVAADVVSAASGHDPDFLTRVFGRVANHAVSGVPDAAVAAVKRNLSAQSIPVQAAATTFLGRIPENVRATFRRPTDPRGITVPPGLSLYSAAELAVVLAGRTPRFKPGQSPLIGVDLELVALLGVGGFGEVWKARNPLLPGVPPVALKFCTDPEAAKLLRHEAAVLDRVMRAGSHPGIVALRHTYLSAEPPALEYEFVAGGDLGRVIVDWYKKTGGPTGTQAAQLLLQLSRAVGFAHSQSPPIVHRDLKPSNILVERRSDGKAQLRVADFGIGGRSGSAGGESVTRGAMLTRVLHGSYTPLYASPQQQAGGPPDPRDDVYALGVVWYQLLTGDLASGAPTGRQWAMDLVAKGVPPPHLDLLARCAEPKPEHRPANAAALAEDLQTLLTKPGGPPVPVPEPAASPPASVPSRDDSRAVPSARGDRLAHQSADAETVAVSNRRSRAKQEGVKTLTATAVWAANLLTLGLFSFYQIPALCQSIGTITHNRRAGFGTALVIGVCTLGIGLIVLLYLAVGDLERYQTAEMDLDGHAGLRWQVGLCLGLSLGWALATLGIGVLLSLVASTYAVWVVQRQVNRYAAAEGMAGAGSSDGQRRSDPT